MKAKDTIVIRKAATVLLDMAYEITRSHTVEGVWPREEKAAQREVEGLRAQAAALRLIAHEAEAQLAKEAKK